MRFIPYLFIPVIILLSCSFVNPTEITIECVLMDRGWDRHFKQDEHNHSHIAQFKSTHDNKIFFIELNLPRNFDSSQLRKHNTFEISIYPLIDVSRPYFKKKKRKSASLNVYSMNAISVKSSSKDPKYLLKAN